MESYDFYVGREYDAQGYLGSHVSEGGVVFRTFAPAADSVVLSGCRPRGWATRVRDARGPRWQLLGGGGCGRTRG